MHNVSAQVEMRVQLPNRQAHGQSRFPGALAEAGKAQQTVGEHRLQLANRDRLIQDGCTDDKRVAECAHVQPGSVDAKEALRMDGDVESYGSLQHQ